MRYLIILVLFVQLVLTSCTKNLDVDTPSFEVSTEQMTVQAGDSIYFRFGGQPDIIYFYSGQLGNDYSFTTGRVMPVDINLSFNSQLFHDRQTNQLSVWISTDFTGDYTMAGVQAAQWKNITDSFTLAPYNVGSIPAGDANISNMVEDGRPFYIGYRYIVRPLSETVLWSRWQVSNFSISAITPLSSASIANQGSAGWKAVLSPFFETNNRIRINSSNLDMLGNNIDNSQYHEAWLITSALTAQREMDFGPDPSLPVKAAADPMMGQWGFVYTTPGVYTATFVAANANAYDDKKVIRQLQITVTN